ncbi:MAG: hypothetical protein HKN37_06460 [Rhodothermales bacterium]|nr:hypothetical protein [Rhodothermales bacterium]
MMCAAALIIPSARTALAQESIPPVPGIDFPFFFDDFDYPADGVTPSPPSDPFVFRHPDGSLFGDNLWLTAVGPDIDLTVERTRAWYEHDWLEYPGDGHIWGYDNPPSDRSWFDPDGVYVSGDLETIMNGMGKLRELSTGARAFDPNFVLFRAEEGDYSDRIASLRISSGFVAQTGSWVARILLPDFDGLRHHDQVDGSAADISFVPAFWLQSSEYFLEEREPMFPRPEDLSDPSQAHDSWSEANFEFNNWYDPDGSEGHKSISTGITWANTFWSNNSQNPRTGASEREGACYVRNDAGEAGGRLETSTRECFEILSGKTHGPLFITVYIVVTAGDVKYYILARDEDVYHGRPAADSAGLYAGFDYFQMTTIDEVRQFAPPRLMRVLFDLNVMANGVQTLPERKDMLIDWVFYTPQILSTESAPSIWNIPDVVSSIRDHLWTRYNRDNPPIWRINTTGVPTARPTVRRIPQQYNPCQGSDRWPGYGLEVEVAQFTLGNRIFLSPETKNHPDQDTFTRHGTFRVTWTAYRWVTGVGRVFAETVTDQGYIYELPDLPAEQWDIEVEVQQVGPHPAHEACTPAATATYTIDLR